MGKQLISFAQVTKFL